MLADVGIIIEMDSNSKLGPEIIKNYRHEMSKNGNLLLDLVKRRNLKIVNGMDLCQGTITRMRDGASGLELSTLDYFIVCEKMVQLVTLLMKRGLMS